MSPKKEALPSAGIENFEFIASERVQVNPENSRAMSALTFLLSKLNTMQKRSSNFESIRSHGVMTVVCWGPVHIDPFSNEKGAVLLRFQKDLRPHLSFSYCFRPSTLQRRSREKPHGNVCPPFWILRVEWSGARSCLFWWLSFSDSIVFSVHTRKQRFQKAAFSNRSSLTSLESVFEWFPFSVIVFGVVVWTIVVSVWKWISVHRPEGLNLHHGYYTTTITSRRLFRRCFVTWHKSANQKIRIRTRYEFVQCMNSTYVTRVLLWVIILHSAYVMSRNARNFFNILFHK